MDALEGLIDVHAGLACSGTLFDLDYVGEHVRFLESCCFSWGPLPKTPSRSKEGNGSKPLIAAIFHSRIFLFCVVGQFIFFSVLNRQCCDAEKETWTRWCKVIACKN